jgi:hAT family C-terminal dimerisation region
MGLDQELDLYLSTRPEKVSDPIHWWIEKRQTYPCLSQMAIDFLTIPGECATLCGVCHSVCHHSSMLCLLQAPQLMLNGCLAEVAFCYHILGTN